MKDVCLLEIQEMELSLDGKYLAVACGIPEKKILIIDVEKRKI